MKLVLIFIIIAITTSYTFSDNTEKGLLTIQIDHVTKAKGEILLAIFTDKESYLKDDKAIPLVVAASKIGSITTSIELEYGTYAISIFHDVNSNKKLDVNGLGIPVEPYGFSNKAPAPFGPPPFNMASFEFTTDGQVETIKLAGKAKKK